MTRLSTRALSSVNHVVEKIKIHPFNVELAEGVLSIEKFQNYIEQDLFYLEEFSRSLSYIASKAPDLHKGKFIKYAKDALAWEKFMVHNFYRKRGFTKDKVELTHATLSYSKFLLKTCENEGFEIGVAGILPCFWVYREVGEHITKKSSKDNQYNRWIETYSSKKFSETVDELIKIFDAIIPNQITLQKMLDIFLRSTEMEWHFWNDAYNMS